MIGLTSTEAVEEVTALCPSPLDLEIVVLIPHPSVTSYEEALRAGALPIDRDADPDRIVETIWARFRRATLAPGAAASNGFRIGAVAPGPGSISNQEVDWLRTLAGGTTVAGLAARVGYSEREMFRRLRALYRRMGADGKTEALVRAKDWGLFHLGCTAVAQHAVALAVRTGRGPGRSGSW